MVLAIILSAAIVSAGRPVWADDLNAATTTRRGDVMPNASGFFFDDNGSLLTARHAVEGCGALYVLKDGRVSRAELIAVSDEADLAVLRTAVSPYLTAVFTKDDRIRPSQPVFTAGYDALSHLKDRATLMYNGVLLDRQPGPGEVKVSLFSAADHGASGSPVLDEGGLVIGLIVRREMAGAGRSEVVAVSAPAIKRFLQHLGLAYEDSELAQVSPLQARAPRAATLMVGIICG
ncbi:S1 family peptidase [Telmatospirillum siberiense]|nr:serine protease [Telmatospirillum siberiense]